MTNQISEVELAFQILSQAGQAMYFKDLIKQVLEMKGRQIHSLAHAMAEVHTQINMDSRFVHMGKGMWGLAEWSPNHCLRSTTAAMEEVASSVEQNKSRRAKLFEEIQQGYVDSSTEQEKHGTKGENS